MKISQLQGGFYEKKISIYSAQIFPIIMPLFSEDPALNKHARSYTWTLFSQLNRSIWILTLLGLPCTAQAIQHTVYIPFIGEEYSPTPNSPDDHTYLTEIRRLREVLTDTLPDPDEGSTSGGVPLRITRDNEEISRITLSSLRQDNTNTLQSVTLLVRNSDLRVVGFINQATRHNTFFRLAEITSRDGAHQSTGSPTPTYIRSLVTWPGTRTIDLDLSSDYPEIERRARIGRYTSNLRISTALLRRDIATLSEFSRINMNREGMRDMAASLLRVLMAYFEALRFHSVAQGIHDSNIDDGGTWTMGQDEAILSENWSSISEFGSQSSFGSSNAGATFFQPAALSTLDGRHTTSYLVSSISTGGILSRSTSWDEVVAVIDGVRYRAGTQGQQTHTLLRHHSDEYVESLHNIRRSECTQEHPKRKNSRGEARTKRHITATTYAPYDKDTNLCSEFTPLLGRTGNTYFMRHTADGVLTTILYA